MKRKCFTLLEMLTVIAIIGILAGLLLPALGMVKEKAKKVKARADISALKLAISTYQQTYGQLPAAATVGSDAPAINSDGAIKGILSGTNARKIVFLELHPDGNFRDPWEAPYQIVIDSNYDGEVTALGKTIYGAAAVWSDGGDETITSWE